MNTAPLVLESVVTLFLIMVVGYVARSFGVLDWNATKKLSGFLVYITNPLLIVISFQRGFSKERLSIFLAVLVASVIIHLGSTVVALLLFRKNSAKEAKVYRFSTVFSNCGFMGYPILVAVFGEEGLFYGACYVMFFTVYMWTFGVFLLSHRKDGKAFRKAIFNPGTLAALAGFLLFVLNIRLPGVVTNTMSDIANLTFPLSMIIIGSMMKNVPLKKLFFSLDVYLYSLVKLIIIPFLVLMFCMIFNVDKGMTYICVIMSAMPAAAKAAIMSEIYKADTALAVSCVEVSTVLSVVTVPLLLYLTEFALSLR